ncbi:MAG: ferritin-like domain-containing protein [Edaphobacter sp.]|uniref:ferritin-like domain-containing protein n=1 Tax=Edaphobacter sp. TaxID=1934404 RepID=UPI00238C3D0B|nr:ferritin-like domain-containing protein [Edaphobacter sp.]MDE1175018.1 ferritin-like domain-containing protein [Edaphobacter sp.]
MGNLEDMLYKRSLSRRRFLDVAGTGAGATAILSLTGGCSDTASSGTTTTTTPPATTTVTDTDILNFALNLEYLEAEYYLRAVTGSGLSSTDAGTSAGAVTGGTQVPFKTPALQQYAMEIANDELAHVRFLRSALGSAAVSRPAIDLTNSFNAAALAAGIGPTFNPFADEDSFVVGAFVFEDVGVTAYHGAASLLTDKTHLAAAAGILATEAYHAGEIRTLLTQLDVPYITYANQISALRAKAGGGAETTLSAGAIVAADSNSISYSRTTDQVLHIVYLNATAGVVKSGGFFPNGLNGTITASAT